MSPPFGGAGWSKAPEPQMCSSKPPTKTRWSHGTNGIAEHCSEVGWAFPIFSSLAKVLPQIVYAGVMLLALSYTRKLSNHQSPNLYRQRLQDFQTAGGCQSKPSKTFEPPLKHLLENLKQPSNNKRDHSRHSQDLKHLETI